MLDHNHAHLRFPNCEVLVPGTVVEVFEGSRTREAPNPAFGDPAALIASASNAGLLAAGAAGRRALAEVVRRNDAYPIARFHQEPTEGGDRLFVSKARELPDGWLRGLGGNDHLEGSPDADLLDGGPDHDRVFGRRGDDLLHGGDGDDELEGGRGARSRGRRSPRQPRRVRALTRLTRP